MSVLMPVITSSLLSYTSQKEQERDSNHSHWFIAKYTRSRCLLDSFQGVCVLMWLSPRMSAVSNVSCGWKNLIRLLSNKMSGLKKNTSATYFALNGNKRKTKDVWKEISVLLIIRGFPNDTFVLNSQECLHLRQCITVTFRTSERF